MLSIVCKCHTETGALRILCTALHNLSQPLPSSASVLVILAGLLRRAFTAMSRTLRSLAHLAYRGVLCGAALQRSCGLKNIPKTLENTDLERLSGKDFRDVAVVPFVSLWMVLGS